LPHEQEPYWVEWVPKEADLKKWFRYTCPSCRTKFAVEKWSGGEPPPPRSLEHLKDDELYEIPRDCKLDVLGAIFRAIHNATKGKQSKKSKPTPEEILNQVVQDYPSIRFPEIREFAKLARLGETWAEDRWSLMLADKLRQCDNWQQVDSLMSSNQSYKFKVWGALSADERDYIKLLKKFNEKKKIIAVGSRVRVDWDGSAHHGAEGIVQEVGGEEVGIKIDGIPWLLFFSADRLKAW
jgi:hypothetical protein